MMEKKPFYRLYFLRQLDCFKVFRESLNNNTTFKNAVDFIDHYNDSTYKKKFMHYLYEIPMNINWIIYRSIRITCDDSLKNDHDLPDEEISKHINTDINWNKLAADLEGYYIQAEERNLKSLPEFTDQITAINQKAVEVAYWRKELMMQILKVCFEVINKYFPIYEYGLPTYNFIQELILSLEGIYNVLSEKPRPLLYDDMAILSLIKENEYLTKKLESKGVNILKEMAEDNFIVEQFLYSSFLQNNSPFYFQFDPGTRDIDIRKNMNEIVDPISLAENSSEKESQMSLETFSKYADLYIVLRYNQKKSYTEIADTLAKKLIDRDPSDIRKKLVEITRLAGFEDLKNK